MYSTKDLKRVLLKNLASEFKVIKFYVDNLENLNYAKNKKKVDSLIVDSFKHAAMITKEVLALHKGKDVVVSKSIRERAMREEVAVREIYAYELSRTSDPKIKKLLRQLIAEEKKHEKIAKSLK
ncbi:MAG: ferritin family protein [Candidatus Woesearchaeota archaeon]